MSYSFSVNAASKAAVKQLVADSFTNVVAAQPSHAADRDVAVAAASAFIDLLVEPADGEEIVVSMNGSLGWKYDAPGSFTGAGVGVSASLRTKVTS